MDGLTFHSKGGGTNTSRFMLRNQDKLTPDVPLGSCEDSTYVVFFYTLCFYYF